MARGRLLWPPASRRLRNAQCSPPPVAALSPEGDGCERERRKSSVGLLTGTRIRGIPVKFTGEERDEGGEVHR
jgi:hypothetical protein